MLARSIFRSVCLLTITGGLALGSAATLEGQESETSTAEQATLYERLGGYDVIAAAVDDFLGRFGSDPELGPFLGGLNASAGARVRQHIVDFLCAESGGPCLYIGQDMETTHEGLGIEDAHFDRVVGHFSDAFEAQGVEEGARRELVSRLNGLRDAVVAR